MTEDLKESLGDTLPPGEQSNEPTKIGPGSKALAPLTQQAIIIGVNSLDEIKQRVANASTHREILEQEAFNLAECVGIATAIYQQLPTSDNASQVATLAQAHKSHLQQLEKMKDPEVQLLELQKLLQNMVQSLGKSLSNEIDKTRRGLVQRYPQEASSIEEYFKRMMDAIAPESTKLFDDVHVKIKMALGMKK